MKSGVDFVSAVRAIVENPNLWIRPEGAKYAFCIQDQQICIVPTPRGAIPYMETKVSIILGKWEILTSDEFYKE